MKSSAGGAVKDAATSQQVTLSQLIAACDNWNLEDVRAVLDGGFCVDTFDDDHVTALQTAAANGNIGIVEYLLDSGADIERSNQVGLTPLHHAARNGHTNVVRILVQRGANYLKLTYYGASAMTLAAAGGHTEVVKLLLDLRVNVNPSHTALCPTPMIAAAFRRHTHICALLSLRGAIVDGHVHRLCNLSALSVAISCGTTHVVAALLELGANPTFLSLRDHNAFELAEMLHNDEALHLLNNSLDTTNNEEERKNVDVREMVVQKKESELRTAMRRSSPGTLSFLERSTPLMYAVLLADINIVSAIVECGGDVNAVETVSGLSALMMAAIVGDSEMIEFLLSAGADISLKSFDGCTAVDYAFASGSVDAETLCFMQRHFEHGSPPLRNESQPHFKRVIQSTTSKFLHRLTGHSRYANTAVVREGAEWRERSSVTRQLLQRALAEAHHDERFTTASEILRSLQCRSDAADVDAVHHCISTVRYLAELSESQGFAPLPVPFFAEADSAIGDRSTSKYASSIGSSCSARSQTGERHKEHFSLAQKNAFLFYEWRFAKNDMRKAKSGVPKNRLIFDEDFARKNSSSTSASGSEEKSPPRLREFSPFERGSGSVLGTTPRVRIRSCETVTIDDDERSSPSRLSLNQYTFATRDDFGTLKKSSSTPLIRSPSSNCFDETTKQHRRASVSNIDGKTSDNDDSVWRRLAKAGLERYVDLLQKEELDEATLAALNESELFGLGVTKHEHCREILKIAKSVRVARKRNAQSLKTFP